MRAWNKIQEPPFSAEHDDLDSSLLPVRRSSRIAVGQSSPGFRLFLFEAYCKVNLLGFDAKAKSGTIRALLDDEVYDLSRSADISAASTPLVFLDGLLEILGSSETLEVQVKL
ncbi:unnamed protein product [Schistocephalus solidus]|uniref:Uncharacterized protein n=1 Tax=Schistocephalus solidus TaxID=70667 RepID=A0A183TA25_SCHSO|nr:unnamed protein product [Schistocephalus solidus]